MSSASQDSPSILQWSSTQHSNVCADMLVSISEATETGAEDNLGQFNDNLFGK